MNSQATRFYTSPQQLKMAHAIEDGDKKTIATMIQTHAVSPNDFGLVHKAQASDEQPISFLTYAVMVRNKAAVEALLDSGANVNFRTPDGWSAMAEAARSPDESILPLLLTKGGDVNARGTTESPITFVAYMSGHLKNMNLLLDRGADINAEDSTQQTLLMTMADLNDYSHMLELLKRGADPTIADNEQRVSVAWTVQESAGNLTPEAELKRQQVIKVLEAKGIRFPVAAPPVYRWDANQHKFVLPSAK